MKIVGDFYIKDIKVFYIFITFAKNIHDLKRIFVILLSTIILVPSFGNLIIYAKFKINQDEIIKTICVQRNLPQNTCQGHCALKKSLKQLEENEKEMQNNLKEKTELVYIQNPIETTSFSIAPSSFTSQKNYSYFGGKPIAVVLSNFRPPSYFI